MAKGKVTPGIYTIKQLLDIAGFDIQNAGADYNDGNPDHRRVTVGGLGFDGLEDKLAVPATADHVEITLDGVVVGKLPVELKTDAHKAERSYAFEVAADVDNPD